MKRSLTAPALTALALALLAPVATGGAEAAISGTLTGSWTITIETPQGSRENAWELEQHDDGTLTGSIGGMQGSSDAEGGWVEEDRFGFHVVREFQGQSVQIEYEGTFTDDALEGTLTVGEGQFTAEFTGVRAGSAGSEGEGR